MQTVHTNEGRVPSTTQERLQAMRSVHGATLVDALAACTTQPTLLDAFTLEWLRAGHSITRHPHGVLRMECA